MSNEQQDSTFYVRKNRPGCANELRAKFEDEWLPGVLLVQQRNADLDRQLDANGCFAYPGGLHRIFANRKRGSR